MGRSNTRGGALLGMSMLALAVLTACGGGGGTGAPANTAAQPPATSPTTTPSSGLSSPPPLQYGPDAFEFRPVSALAAPGALDQLSDGSQLFAAWNPTARTALAPGMKVMFFGSAEGCTSGTEGPLAAPQPLRLPNLLSAMGVDGSGVTTALRWSPSGAVAGCDLTTQAKLGGSAVLLNADDTTGALGLLTTSGVQDDGQRTFFGPLSAAGQNGSGANAHITGSFVTFRQAWTNDPTPHKPWQSGGAARLQSRQIVGSVRGIDTAGTSTRQAKQQIIATFINPICRAELAAQGKLCQIQYLFNTAIYRSGVSDWNTQDWFKTPRLLNDPGQGGMPVFGGPVPDAGTLAVDAASGLALYRSQGEPTQHGRFQDKTFDVTIGFDQLGHALKLVVASVQGVAPASVTDAMLAAHWGSAWNQRSAWVLLSTQLGQEIYNPEPDLRVEIAGGARHLYVGPQD